LKCQDKFIKFFVSNEIIKGTLRDACNWYQRHLQTNFINHWQLITTALVGIEENSIAPAQGDFVVVYNYVLAVAKLFKSRRNIALVEIVDELDNDGVFKSDMDDERSTPNQLVHATLGWLSKIC